MPFGQIMPSWTVAMDGVQLQYLVLISEYKAQFFPSCLKCFAFMFFFGFNFRIRERRPVFVGFNFRIRERRPVFVGREKSQFGTSST